jgi:hypothetical protein
MPSTMLKGPLLRLLGNCITQGAILLPPISASRDLPSLAQPRHKTLRIQLRFPHLPREVIRSNPPLTATGLWEAQVPNHHPDHYLQLGSRKPWHHQTQSFKTRLLIWIEVTSRAQKLMDADEMSCENAIVPRIRGNRVMQRSSGYAVPRQFQDTRGLEV